MTIDHGIHMRHNYGDLFMLFVVLCVTVSLAGCIPLSATETLPSTRTLTPDILTSTPPQNLPGWLSVYFTNPDPPDNIGHGIDQVVVQAMDSATQSIEVASFDFNLPSVIDAMVNASQRGVKVEVVYDGTNGNLELDNEVTNNQPFDSIQVLKAAHISVVDGGRDDGLMHNKFILIDQRILFVGSWNISYNDTYRNNNNLLRITDAKLIANYQAKFNELFNNKKFGTRAQVKVPYPFLTIDSVQVENYFAPEDQVMSKLINEVKGATKSVHFLAYTYTSEKLASAMIQQAKAGIEVRGVIEDRDALDGAFANLFCASLLVRTDGNPYNMHDKVIIIDGETVITGSFNFTVSADTVNDENVIFIHSPAVAALYEQEFARIYSIGKTPDKSGVCK